MSYHTPPQNNNRRFSQPGAPIKKTSGEDRFYRQEGNRPYGDFWQNTPPVERVLFGELPPPYDQDPYGITEETDNDPKTVVNGQGF